jgi:hypothetical protein
MKKLIFSGVKIPVLILLFVSLIPIGCQKGDSGGGGVSPGTPITLIILPSSNITVNQGSAVTFTWSTNASTVKVNGVTCTTGSYTSEPLQNNTDFTVTAFNNPGSSDQNVTIIVHVTITTAPPPNPTIVAVTSNPPWKIHKKEGQLTGPWFEYTLNPCELDDTQKFNLDGTVTWLDNANQCSPVPYPPGSWSLPYPDSLRWNNVNRGILKATSDTLRLQWATPCSGGGCPASGLALVRVTYIK